MPVWLIVSATGVYMALLFAIAWRQDARSGDHGFRQHPIVYALALAVYCTSWTFYGAVGTAVASGWDYLPIYLGPAIVFLLGIGLIRRIGDIAQREGTTSLSDFLSARYGKSRAVGALATVVAVLGTLPYISLQLKSVGDSFQMLAHGAVVPGTGGETVLLTSVVMAAFAIVFGARNPDSTKRNPGLMSVLAIEAVAKFLALAAVCVLAIVVLDAPAVPAAPGFAEMFPTGMPSGRFVTITLLAMAAIICLPRQFHVAITERRGNGELKLARWFFPSYLLFTALMAIPIAIAGTRTLDAVVPADLFVLALPMAQGDGILAMLVFLGGFSAASGMIIVSAIALSTMVTHDVVVPLSMRFGKFATLAGDAGERLLTVRRLVIVVLLGLAYGYYDMAASEEGLAQTGLLAFAAAAQFAPALLFGMFWRGARRGGVLAGLGAGGLLWVYCLALPALFGAEVMASALPDFLDPHGLFGLDLGDSLSHGVFVSLLANVALLVLVSRWSDDALADRVQAQAFVDNDSDLSDTGVTPDGLRALALRFLSREAVDAAFEEIGRETGEPIHGNRPATWMLVQRTEQMLTRVLGSSSARVIMASAVGRSQVGLSEILAVLETRSQSERFDRHMLQSMLENIAQGISVVDRDQRLVAWNTAYAELFSYPQELLEVGQPIGNLIEFNTGNGWIESGSGNTVNRRVDLIRAGRAHRYERRHPDGRWLRIIGNPMPGGGYLTTFTDITMDKEREQALVDANERLEERVAERTEELEHLTAELDRARIDAEAANRSKTRFLAAASHDLLQPLNAARLFLAAAQTASTQDAERLLKADRSIQSADSLLKGLLDISRLDQGDVTPDLKALPVGPLLEDLADEAAPMAERAGLSLRVVASRLAVHADPDFLQSIVRNFLSNARRYTDSGGIVLGARRRGNKVRIEVWDTGPGIDPDDGERLFDEFQRLHDVDNQGIRGAGLGLSVALRMARIMGADVGFESRLGRGSVFYVELPRIEMKPARTLAPAAPVTPIASELASMRVLCIDDEPTILDAMEMLLSSWGVDVTLASSVDEARAQTQRQPFDAVIADFNLGRAETGLDVLKGLRRNGYNAGQLTLLTAVASADVEAYAASFGIRILHKPVDADDLRSFLSRARALAVSQEAPPPADTVSR